MEEQADYQLALRERDLSADMLAKRIVDDELQIAIYRMAWHTGFAAGMEIAQDVLTDTLKK